MIVGGALIATGGLTSVHAPVFSDSRSYDGLLIGIIGLGVAAVGLLVLDQDGSKDVQFQALSSESAQRLGLSANSIETYNSELDELNAIKNSISAELSLTESPSLEKSATLWSEYQGRLSAETMQVVKAVVAQGLR